MTSVHDRIQHQTEMKTIVTHIADFSFRNVLLVCALSAGFGPAAMAQTLNVAIAAAPSSTDPQHYTFTPNNSVAMNMFETLVRRSPQSRPEPGLAESWTRIDDTTWEFRLRRGIKFHNGADFTADDVLFTLERIPTVVSPSSFTVYIRSIASTEVIDPYTIRFHTRTPYPLLPVDMMGIWIISRSIAATSSTADFNSGRATIGTGPYRFVSFTPGDRVVMQRNDAYWGNRPHWQSVNYRTIANDGARTAALLSGDVDIIDNAPASDLARLRRDERLRLTELVSTRLVFLGVDVFRENNLVDITGPNGETLTANPLRDQRVRQALSMGINRQAITSRTMENAGVPSGQFMPAGTFGYSADIPVPAYDPNRAKALLAEAGYPNGFRIVLRGPNDRYINDTQIVQAVGQMWTRIGVRTEVQTSPMAAHISQISRYESAAFLLGWSNPTGEPSLGMSAILATPNAERGLGRSNYGRYSNPRFDAALAQAMATMDDAQREQALIAAERMAMQEDIGIIPLHIQKCLWAMRRTVAYPGRIDEQTEVSAITPVQ